MRNLSYNWKKYISFLPFIGAILLTIVLLLLLIGTRPSNTTEITATPNPTGTPLVDCKSDSVHVGDDIISAERIQSASIPFTKTWRVRNTGECAWDEGYALVFITGTIGVDTSSSISPTKPGKEVNISLSMVFPSVTGTFSGEWQLQDANGQRFGEPLGVTITVVEITSANPSTPEPAATSTPIVMRGVLLLIVLIVVIVVLLWLFRRKGADGSPPFARMLSSPTDPSGRNAAKVLPATVPPPLGTPYLESLARPAGKVYYALTQPVITVGRAKDDHLMIDESFVGWHTVSRKHAKLEREGRHIILVDLNSENGVYVNDLPIGENLLINDCIITLGQVKFAFRLNRANLSA